MWGAGGLSAAIAALGTGLLVSAPAAHGVPSPGVGSSYAQSIQDTPKDGSLSVGAVLGEALAGHTNGVARAQSQGLDETAIGASLQAYNCGQAPSPSQLSLVSQPLQTETGQPGADQGVTEDPTTGLSTEGSNQLVPPTFGSTEFVRATGTPYGEADTSYGSLSAPGMPFSASGLHSRAWSGIVDGQRVAAATEDIKTISLGGGAVVLNGLHWEAMYPSGGTATPSASFSIGALTIQGTSAPTSNPTSALTAANAILGQLGLQLGVPTVSSQQGIIAMTPLELDVVPNSTRDGIIDPVTTQVSPVAIPVEHGLTDGFSPQEPAQLQQQLCQSDNVITTGDIAIASINGGGSYVTSFGGVDATSGDAPSNPFNLSLPAFGLGSAQTQFIPGTAGTPGRVGGASSTPSGGSAAGAAPSTPLGSAGPAGGSPSPTANSSGGGPTRNVNLAAAGTSPGGPLLGIGLGGLGALLLLGEGDRRLMRRAQRGRARFDTFEE
jgi:hypothetical protein